jgi:hypothetical protein
MNVFGGADEVGEVFRSDLAFVEAISFEVGGDHAAFESVRSKSITPIFVHG